MNKDSNKSLEGSKNVKGTKYNYFTLAKYVAQKHTNKIVTKFYEKLKSDIVK